LSVSEKEQMNIWDSLDDFLKVYTLMQNDEWTWSLNSQCKYIDLRIDMRDGACLIKAKGERISPERLAWQYSEETLDPPKD
jgi:hypothetical protein